MTNTTQAFKDQPEIVNYSYDNMSQDLKKIIQQIAKVDFKPNYILGLTRGGLVPATMLSHYYNVPLVPINLSLRDFKTNLDFVQEEIKRTVGKDVLLTKQLLVVDDIVDTGDTLQELFILFNKIKQSVLTRKADNIQYATLFYNKTNRAKFKPDFYAHEFDKTVENKWIVFPFEEWYK